MKNLLTRWETKKENRKIGGDMPLIEGENSSDVLLIDRKRSGNVLLIDRELAELEDDAESTSLSKLIQLVKKLSNLTRTRKEKPHWPIFYFLTCFVELVRRPCFYF